MELNEYQEKAMTTCMESSNNVAYMFYNLLGEVGELAEKMALRNGSFDLAEQAASLDNFSALAKMIRKEPDSFISKLEKQNFCDEEMKTDTNLQKECGDILWQLAGLCSVMGWELEDIAQQNLDKLASRQERGKIDGDGDNR